jgi:hypothetical protein
MEYMIKGRGFRGVSYGRRGTRSLRFLFRENDHGRK